MCLCAFMFESVGCLYVCVMCVCVLVYLACCVCDGCAKWKPCADTIGTHVSRVPYFMDINEIYLGSPKISVCPCMCV